MASQLTTYLGAGPAVSRPATPALAAGTVGLWWNTDTLKMDAYDLVNNAWSVAGGSIDLSSPPLAASFPTIINGDSISPPPSVTDTTYGMVFDSGATIAADRIRGAFQPIPHATTFTTVVGMRITKLPQQYRGLGLFVTDGTKYMSIFQITTDLQVSKYTNASSFSSTPVTITSASQNQWYFKIVGNGTNIKFSYSNDGRNFIEVYSEAIGAFLGTITKIGIGGNCYRNTGIAAGDHMFADVFYWSSTTP